MKPTLAIIGGTGAIELSIFNGWKWDSVTTRFGEIEYAYGRLAGVPSAFFPRHGRTHSIPPNLVNYQGLVAGIRALDIRKTIGIAAVGTLTEAVPPGGFAVLSDFIDMTRRRQSTFFDQPGSPVVHTDFTTPYCPQLSTAVLEAFKSECIEAVTPCVYICVDGPRYETPAEIKTFRSWGADVVGMTNVPEVVLAREAGICYTAIVVPTNYAAGISPVPLAHEDVVAQMKRQDGFMTRVLPVSASLVSQIQECRCQLNWDKFGVFLAGT